MLDVSLHKQWTLWWMTHCCASKLDPFRKMQFRSSIGWLHNLREHKGHLLQNTVVRKVTLPGMLCHNGEEISWRKLLSRTLHMKCEHWRNSRFTTWCRIKHWSSKANGAQRVKIHEKKTTMLLHRLDWYRKITPTNYQTEQMSMVFHVCT